MASTVSCCLNPRDVGGVLLARVCGSVGSMPSSSSYPVSLRPAFFIPVVSILRLLLVVQLFVLF